MIRWLIFLLILHSAPADITTPLSYHHSDVQKIKCDSVPYRSIQHERKCYYVMDTDFDVAAKTTRCSTVLPGAQFAQPMNVSENVWSSLFVNKNLFLGDGDSVGKSKIMCIYESPFRDTLNTTKPKTRIVNTICFRKQTSTVRKAVIDRPKVIDEYHCKMICVEREDCFSYFFYTGKCTLLGKKNVGYVCENVYQEWAKKTTDAECPDNIDQPAIDIFGYVENPALVGSTLITIKNFTFNTLMACPERAIIHTTLPDNSHRVRGSVYNGIYWDEKLGSWMLVLTSDYRKVISTYYIRSARCYDVNPSRFTSTTSCGGALPLKTAVKAGYKSVGPVERYGGKQFCGSHDFMFTADYKPTTDTNRKVDAASVACIGGSWLFLYGYPAVQSASTIHNGACVTKI